MRIRDWRIAFVMLLLCGAAIASWGACPLLVHPDPSVEREFQNVCQSISGQKVSDIGTVTANSLTPGNCVQVDAGHHFQSYGAPCGTVAGASNLAVTAGTSSGFSTVISSPTQVLLFSNAAYGVSLQGGATAFVTPSPSSVTLQGNTFNAANKLVKMDGSGKIPAPASNKDILFNSGGSISGASGFEWDGSAMAVPGSLTASGMTVTPGALLISNQQTFGTGSIAGHNVYSTTYKDVGDVAGTFGYDNGGVPGFFWQDGTGTWLLNLRTDTGNAKITYGLTVSTLTISSIASGTQCLQANSAGLVSGTGSTCGTASGGASSLAVTTGTSSGFSTVISSPTQVLLFNGSAYTMSLQGGATAFVTPNVSSVTLQGNTFNAANKLVKMGSTGGISVSTLTISSIASGTQCLQADGSGNVSGTGSACGAGGGGGSPGGSTGNLQVNSAGSFAGRSQFNVWPSSFIITSSGNDATNLLDLTVNDVTHNPNGLVVTSTGAGSGFVANLNGSDYGTNDGSAGFIVSCAQDGTQGNCGEFYSNAGTQNALTGVLSVIAENPNWNTATLYVQALGTNPQNGIRVDGNDYSTLELIDTLQHTPGGKFQFSSHNNQFRGERRNAANDAYESAWTVAVSTNTWGGVMYVGTDYDNPASTLAVSGNMIIGTGYAGHSTGGTAPDNGLLVQGHIVSPGFGATPALSTCGGSPSITGSDMSGVVTPGSGSPTACTLTFASAFGSTPACVVSPSATGITSALTSVSASAATFGFSASPSKFYYYCMSTS